MLFTKADLQELEQYLDDYFEYDFIEEEPPTFFGERPYLLLPGHFQDSRLLYLDSIMQSYGEDDPDYAFVRKAMESTREFMDATNLRHNEFMNEQEYAFKRGDTGVWYWFDGIQVDHLLFHGPANLDTKVPLDDLVRSIRRCIEYPETQAHSIIFPRYYIDVLNHHLRGDLRLRTVETLRRLYDEQEQLSAIDPHVLEDIVAELLVGLGMQIYQTPRSRDGGRDIVAKSEVAPGFFVHMAVEVKQKRKVGIPEVSRVLQANRDYPKVLIATTGTFTAGVYGNKVRDEYFLRLELADGVALSQLIKGYGNRFFV